MAFDRIAGVVLAAGAGTRMGRLKQLLPYQGRPLLEWVIEAALDGGLDPVVVVLGHAEATLRRRIDFKQALICSNRGYAGGQSTSLQAGLEAVPTDCAAAMFLLGDQPLVQAGMIRDLVRAYAASRPWLTIPTWNGARGNPVIVDRALFKRIRNLRGDTGARALFAEMADRVLEVPVDQAGVVMDVDTPEDYERLLRAGEGVPDRMDLVDALDLRLPAMISAVGGGGKTSFLFALGDALRSRGCEVLLTTTTAIYHPGRSGRPIDRLVIGPLPEDLFQSGSGGGRLVVAALAHDRLMDKLQGYAPEYLEGLQAGTGFDAVLVEADGARGLPVKAPAAHEPVVPACSDLVVGVIGLDCLGKPLTRDRVHRPGVFAAVTGLEPGVPIPAEALVRLAQAPEGLFKGVGPAARRVVLLNKADTVQRIETGKTLADLILGRPGSVERVLVAGLHRGALCQAVLTRG